MMRSTLAALAVAFALPSLAQAENFEVLTIGSADQNGSNFYMASIRGGLSFGSAAVDTGSARNAKTGLRFRLDLARSSYDTNFDSVAGSGTGTTYRLLLAYGIPLNADTTLTLTGGVSHRTVEVRPVTVNSPADSSQTGPFASIDFEYSPETFGSFQLLAEHDSVGSNFASMTYLANLGPNVRLGPTVNYIADGSYARTAYGLSAIYSFGDAFEIKATAAKATQKITGNPNKSVDYFEMQFRMVF